MKKFIVLSALLLISQPLWALDYSNTNDTIMTTGNVAIGTTSTGNKLTVSGYVGIGTTSPSSVYLSTKAPDGGMLIEGNVGIGTTAPLGLLQVGTSPNEALVVTAAGNVGIGTTASSSYKLYVKGDTYLDIVSSGSLAIPQGASPTVDAAGKIAQDTTDDQLLYGATPRVIPYYSPIAIIINSPTASGDGAAIRIPYAVTVKAVHVLCIGGTNWIGHLDECDANGGTCAGVDGATDITATAGANANDDGSLSNPTIDSGDYIGVHTTSVSGTPTRTIITFEYTVDRQ